MFRLLVFLSISLCPLISWRQNNIEDYATIEAYVGPDEVPVYAFGYTFVYGSGPDLLPSGNLQEENTHPISKFKLKKSWEITSNYCGSTPAREPKTMWNDDQPLLPIHLIDGDTETVWSSRGMTAPGVQPEWIRIDLPKENVVAGIALVCSTKGPHADPHQRIGKSLPGHLTIKVSVNGKDWDTAYENSRFSDPDSGSSMIKFEPRRAKMIWVIGDDFKRVCNWGRAFSIGEIKVLDPSDVNLALVSRGASVQVSTTYYGYGMDRFTQEMLWPIQYDLGFKWTRVGYDIGLYLWSYVEREKGVLRIDPKADEAVTEAHKNGVNVILCLDKGNWLYHAPPRKTGWRRNRVFEMMETYYDHQGWPHESKAMLEGYHRYVEYMARHFSGRVAFYEICNEWSHSIGIQNYLKLLPRTIEIIKRADPQARIMLGSVNPYRGEDRTIDDMGGQRVGGIDKQAILECLKGGEPKIATLIDAVGWHPWYQADPSTQRFRNYRKDFASFKEQCAQLGFDGTYVASEWSWMAPYPRPKEDESDWPVENWTSEMQKAKYCAQLMTAHSGMGVVSLYNETFQSGRIERDVTLLRNSTFQVDPITPPQPQPVYYVLRNISSVLDGYEPVDFPAQINSATEVEIYTFQRGDHERMVAAWIPGKTVDGISFIRADLKLPETLLKNATIYDIFNGNQQTLDFSFEENTSILRGIRIKDYPVFVEYTW